MGVKWDLWGSVGVYRSLVGRWVLLLTSNGHVHGAYRRALVSGISTIITIQSTEYVHRRTQIVTNTWGQVTTTVRTIFPWYLTV